MAAPGRAALLAVALLFAAFFPSASAASSYPASELLSFRGATVWFASLPPLIKVLFCVRWQGLRAGSCPPRRRRWPSSCGRSNRPPPRRVIIAGPWRRHFPLRFSAYSSLALFSRLLRLRSLAVSTTATAAVAARPKVRYEGGYAVDTVFDGSKLGIEPHAVEITPAGDLLVLDSINSNIYRVQLPLSPCEHALPPTTPLSFFSFFSLHSWDSAKCPASLDDVRCE